MANSLMRIRINQGKVAIKIVYLNVMMSSAGRGAVLSDVCVVLTHGRTLSVSEVK